MSVAKGSLKTELLAEAGSAASSSDARGQLAKAMKAFVWKESGALSGGRADRIDSAKALPGEAPGTKEKPHATHNEGEIK